MIMIGLFFLMASETARAHIVSNISSIYPIPKVCLNVTDFRRQLCVNLFHNHFRMPLVSLEYLKISFIGYPYANEATLIGNHGCRKEQLRLRQTPSWVLETLLFLLLLLNDQDATDSTLTKNGKELRSENLDHPKTSLLRFTFNLCSLKMI